MEILDMITACADFEVSGMYKYVYSCGMIGSA